MQVMGPPTGSEKQCRIIQCLLCVWFFFPYCVGNLNVVTTPPRGALTEQASRYVVLPHFRRGAVGLVVVGPVPVTSPNSRFSRALCWWLWIWQVQFPDRVVVQVTFGLRKALRKWSMLSNTAYESRTADERRVWPIPPPPPPQQKQQRNMQCSIVGFVPVMWVVAS